MSRVLFGNVSLALQNFKILPTRNWEEGYSNFSTYVSKKNYIDNEEQYEKQMQFLNIHKANLLAIS